MSTAALAKPDPMFDLAAGASRYSHAQLVERAVKWLKRAGCSIVLPEFSSVSEIPDAIGWRGADTMLVECKTSRGDFLADRKKPWRMAPSAGLGKFRYFMCEPGLIRVYELPPRWGLLYVRDRDVSVEAGPNPKHWPGVHYWGFAHDERYHHGETRMLLSALRRMQISLGAPEFHRLVNLRFSERQAEARA